MDHTAAARELYDDLPFHRENDIEVLEATSEGARTRWPFQESLVGNPEVPAIHGGVLSALADLTGAAPFCGALGRYTPTIDLRVDYLTHAGEADLEGEATVVRRGNTVGVADVQVTSDGRTVATAKGVYKLDR
ncbi:PaaI family thioesterase [Natronomonas sp. EA1]|uniref:PaaI family thioesterase n=1 Tax=Natronomonas sp. EA1 TaxID=3421655 RepID=UPI003EBC3873